MNLKGKLGASGKGMVEDAEGLRRAADSMLVSFEDYVDVLQRRELRWLTVWRLVLNVEDIDTDRIPRPHPQDGELLRLDVDVHVIDDARRGQMLREQQRRPAARRKARDGMHATEGDAKEGTRGNAARAAAAHVVTATSTSSVSTP